MESLSSLLDAGEVIENLLLAKEILAIKWQFIKAFWVLDKRLSTAWSHTFLEWDRVRNENITDIGFHTNSWFMITDKSRLISFLNGEQQHVAENVYFATYNKDGSLWTLGRSLERHSFSDQGRITTEVLLSEMELLHTGFIQFVISPFDNTVVLSSDDRLGIYKIKEKKLQVLLTDRTLSDRTYYPTKTRLIPMEHQPYAFYNIGKRLYKVDLIEEKVTKVFEEAVHCEIQDIALKEDNKLIMISHSTVEPSAESSISVCGLRIFELGTDGDPKLSDSPQGDANFKEFDYMTMDAKHEILVLGKKTDSKVHFVNLESNPISINTVDLNPGYNDEFFSSISKISLEQSRFFIRTNKRDYSAEVIDGRVSISQIYDLPKSDCYAHALYEHIVCVNTAAGIVSQLKSKTTIRLQPTLLYEVGRHSLNGASSVSGTKSIIDSWQNSVTLLNQVNEAQLTMKFPTRLVGGSLSRLGKYAVAILEGNELIIFNEKEMITKVPITVGENINCIGVSDSGRIYIVSTNGFSNIRQLDTWVLTDSKIQKTGHSQWTEAATPNKIVLNPKGNNAVVYSELFNGYYAAEQNFFVFDNVGNLLETITANNARINFTYEGDSFYVVRDDSIFLHMLKDGNERLIAKDLPFNPHEILEGQTLIARENTSYYDIATLQPIVPDGVLGVTKDYLLVWANQDNHEIRIYSPDGKQEIMRFDGLPSVNSPILAIGSDPQSSFFHVWSTVKNNEIILKTYTLDPNTASLWLKRWQ